MATGKSARQKRRPAHEVPSQVGLVVLRGDDEQRATSKHYGAQGQAHAQRNQRPVAKDGIWAQQTTRAVRARGGRRAAGRGGSKTQRGVCVRVRWSSLTHLGGMLASSSAKARRSMAAGTQFACGCRLSGCSRRLAAAVGSAKKVYTVQAGGRLSGDRAERGKMALLAMAAMAGSRKCRKCKLWRPRTMDYGRTVERHRDA